MFPPTSTVDSSTITAEGGSSAVEGLAARLGRRPTLLAIWAHPDDESYLGGGLMAAVATLGGRVVSVSATLGEHGTADRDVNPPAELAARRGCELADALDRLGTAAAITLGHEDGTCGEVDDALGARRVATLIAQVDPDAVLTFGPDGVTGHADHRAVGRWTAAAVADHGGTIPLLTTATQMAWPGDLVEAMHRVGAFYPGYPQVTPGGPVHRVTVAGPVLEAKLAALAAHRSQVGPMQAELGPTGYRRLAAAEAYCAANAAAVARLGDPFAAALAA